MSEEQKNIIKGVLDQMRKTCFVEKYQDQVKDEEIMGLLLAKYFDWDGVKILNATYNALEDSNFHEENKALELIIDKVKGQYPKLNLK